eukprot:TRINITY_DN992_c2_g1_i3.p1 TRINITY_DN992_c2_g1~~TRINITY_DN992_c2_g1_i3.p1  ORF type:complete len:248 (-),score=41.43 TRINITY_DN992_c2_g1_i3:186-929(-)
MASDSERLRFWETNHVHRFPWNQVAAGYWFRYPNQHSSHVFSVDTLETKITDGKLYTRRLIVKTNPLPSWGKHFFSVRRVPVIEECIVDPKGRTLVWYTRNIGLDRFMSTVEKATLSQCPEAPMSQTNVLKQVWIGSSIIGFRSAIKKFGIDRYKKNCVLATEGFETVLSEHFINNDDNQETTQNCGDNTSEPSSSSLADYCPYTKNPGKHDEKNAQSAVSGGNRVAADISLSNSLRGISSKQTNVL